MSQKLREIYEALDSNQPKNAVRLCTNLIKQQKNVLQARTMKALAHERLGQFDLALEECNLVLNEHPTDDDILKKLHFVYRSLGRLDQFTICCENAYNKNPTEQSALAVFLCYTKECRFADQQKWAFKLMKTYPNKVQYLYYAALSMIQKVPGDKLATDPSIVMAERTVDKVEAQNGFSTPEELHLMLLLCDYKKNYQKAYDLIVKYSKLYKRVQDSLSRQAHYLVLLNRLSEAKQIYQDLLVEHHEDNWEFLMKFFDCISSGEWNQDAVTEARKLLSDLASHAQTNNLPPQRMIHLGEVELNFRIHNFHSTPENLQAFEDSCAKFFGTFVSRLSTFRDLMLYLKKVPNDVFIRLVERFIISVPTSETVTVNSTYSKVVAELFKTKAGFYSNLNEEQAETLIKDYLESYHQALAMPSSKEIPSTEHQHGDELILLGAHVYIDLYQRLGKNLDFLVKALLLLMYGLSKSKCNYQFKVIAIRLYCLLGDLKASCKLFESLDVKYIQFDTFTQILLDDAVALRIGSFTSTLLNAMEKFYTDARKELSDLIALPYRYNSYSRVREFLDFKEKLFKTQQGATLAVEIAWNEILGAKFSLTETLPKLKHYQSRVLTTAEQVAGLHDTADWTYWDDWHSIESLASEFVISCGNLKTRCVEQQKLLLRLRGVKLHLLINLLEFQAGESSKLLESFLELYGLVSPLWNDSSRESWNALVLLFRFAVQSLTIIDAFKESQVAPETANVWNELLGEFQGAILKVVQAVNDELAQEKFVGRTVAKSGFLVFTLGLAHLIFQTFQANIPKRLRKTADANTKNAHRDLRNNLKTLQTTLSAQTTGLIQSFTPLTKVKVDLSTTQLLDVTQNLVEDLQAELNTSYHASFSELVKILQALNVV